MINVEQISEKTVAFVCAYEEVGKMVYANELNHEIAVAARIDEQYALVSAFNGDFWAIAKVEGNELAFWYGPEDEWTFGDLLGGYLDLYFEK